MSKPVAGPGRASAEVRRLRAERDELRERLELLLRLADDSANLIFLYDLEAARLVYANRRFQELLGYAPSEVTAPGFDFLVLIAPDSVEKVRASHGMHLRGEDHLPFEYAMVTRDGRRLEVMLSSWLATWAGHRAVVGFITDITAQRRLAEDERSAAERAAGEHERAESVIAALGDSIIIQDRAYRITYQNDVNRARFGDHLGELCYRTYEGLEHVCPGCPVERTFADGQVHRRVTAVEHGGQTLHLELVSSPLRDASGKVVAGLKLVRDITEQVEAAAALRRAKEDLERQNVELRALDRMKDGLVRDVSHELKTPVAKQAMQLEILRLQLGESCRGPVARTLAVMEDAVHRQQRVIRNLLDLARLESGRRVFRSLPVRVDEVLARVLEDCRPALEASGFAVALHAEPLTATGDAEMLWHVLSNLVNNAVKFAAPARRRLELSARREEDRAVVRVADNGIGMAPAELERAFERFYQVASSIEGSGVGLSICRSIMEGMGGTIALASPGRGRGLTATLTLPVP
ncbi:MAG TPA: ATP-binding protein [Candidatus Methanoperedens sp.]|nr:ATP-binding protein [Candidatus Methanoperedens sp.]